MAENNEDRSREDLTEEASPHRLEEFRQKGMIPQSREVSGLLALLAAGVTLYAMSPAITSHIAGFMREVFRTDLSSRMDLGSMHVLGGIFTKSIVLILKISLPACVAGFVVGALASFAQVGAIFTTEPLNFDLSKIDPFAGLQRLFSAKQAFDSIRLLLKAVAVVLICYAIVKADILHSPAYALQGAGSSLLTYGHVSKVIFFGLIATLSIFAAIDFGLQRWEFSKQVRMTKQEARQEHKEREGDPQIKARIRAVQRDMARKRMMAAVKKADVIVTNPTHIAVALVYDNKQMSAPRVVAKGADFVAQKIKQIAAEAGVPLVENVPLARTLYKTVKVGQFVPRALYQAVAEVLAYVYRLKNRRNV